MKILLVALALLCGPVFADDLVTSQGGEMLRLDVSKPCTEKFIDKAVRSQYLAASSVIGKDHFRACWTRLGSLNAALVIYEDGDYGIVPLGDLKIDQGI